MNRTLSKGARITSLALVLAAGGALMTSPTPVSAQQSGGGSYFDSLPQTITLTGVVRDFKARSQSGGHTDFERQPTRGFAHYFGIAGDTLDQDGKPVYASGGRKVSTQYRDSAGRNIMPPTQFFPARSNDRRGTLETADGGAVVSSSSFSQWFRDVPGVNISRPLSITLTRQPGTNIYTFDDRSDPAYANRGGFFPIDRDLFGNYNSSHNFHFSFELDTRFTYKRGTGQVFTFIGDDDVFVFIDGKKVIDLGGVHSAVSQTIDLDRLTWLEDGKTYSLKFFFVERHTTQSNFRIETSLALLNADLPATSALYD